MRSLRKELLLFLYRKKTRLEKFKRHAQACAIFSQCLADAIKRRVLLEVRSLRLAKPYCKPVNKLLFLGLKGDHRTR